MSTAAERVLLVATVGGAPEPVLVSLAHWHPGRVLFIASEQTASLVPQIMARTQARGLGLGPGAYETIVVTDPEQLVACVHAMRRLDEEVRSWLKRGGDYRVVVDYTGGTKTMSAALALVSHRWKCSFSYVGGRARTNEGVGVVLSGAEAVVAASNPWDELGYRGIDDACEAFNAGKYGLAADVAKKWSTAVTDPPLKRAFATLWSFIEAYAEWDRFQHGRASKKLADVIKNANDLHVLFGWDPGDRLLAIVRGHQTELKKLASVTGPSDAVVRDLLANARRREAQGQYDDAVARLYRAIEAAAQARLAAQHGLPNTGRVPLEGIPESLRATWSLLGEDGVVTLGLQDAYRLLHALGDPLGQRFFDLRLHEPTSALSARNHSILAHGFEPVSRAAFEKLWNQALELCGVGEQDLPSFPSLARSVT